MKTLDDAYTCALGAWISKVVHGKLNVADFHCKHEGKYSLNVNIGVTYIGDRKAVLVTNSLGSIVTSNSTKYNWLH